MSEERVLSDEQLTCVEGYQYLELVQVCCVYDAQVSAFPELRRVTASDLVRTLRHWQGRALAAEAEAERLRRRLL